MQATERADDGVASVNRDENLSTSYARYASASGELNWEFVHPFETARQK
jgi:hypothetical protein